MFCSLASCLTCQSRNVSRCVHFPCGRFRGYTENSIAKQFNCQTSGLCLRETTKKQPNILITNCLSKFLCFSLTVYLMLSVVHGSQATPVYTLMLRCSQNAPQSVQTTCYSFLGTLEILGKQFSFFIAGVLTEALGYVAGLYISLVVSFFVVILVWHCPKYLRCP